jgi:Sap, sulfolipid-1-addressing protein
MGGVIGETLPLGLGIALNPISIVVAILIIGTVNTPKNGIAFAFGWISGLTVLLVLTSLLVQVRSTADPVATRTIVHVGKIAFGLIFILVAAWGLRRRPRGGEDLGSQRWTHLVNEGSAVRSFGLGLFLSDFSIKNFALVAAAASVIGQAGLDNRGMAIAVATFVLICTIGILVPLFIRVFGNERGDRLLAVWREWLERNVAPITAVVMVLLGTHLIAQGIGGLM